MIERVLVADDLGSAGPAIVRAALEISGRATPMTILHVVDDEEFQARTEGQQEDEGYLDRVAADVGYQIRERLRRELGDDLIAEEVRIRVLPGPVHTTILDAAEHEGASLIAVGVRHRSRVGKLIMGSVSQSVLLNAPCPVLAVPIE